MRQSQRITPRTQLAEGLSAAEDFVQRGLESGHHVNGELPVTIGNEGGGVVLAVGEGVSSVAVGDRVVLPLSHTQKYHQQRVVAWAAELVVVPRDADPQQVSMMVINPVSASLLLSEYVDLKSGDAVFFNSATSGLSQWLIALAKERGLRTIGLVRKAADVETVKGRGCDHVIADDDPLARLYPIWKQERVGKQWRRHLPSDFSPCLHHPPKSRP